MRTLLTALLAGAMLALNACTPPAPRAEPAIWRISDADSEIWLYGTVHLLPEGVRWRGPRVEAAFAAAEEFVTETDTSDAAAQEIGRLAQELGALPAGEQLAARLAPEQQARLARVARTLDLDPAALDRMQPWFAALQLSYAAATRAGHRPDLGVEAVLTPEALRQGKRLGFLETGAQQVRILAGLPAADQVRFLDATLDDVEAGASELAAMDEAWARGDVETLQRLLADEWRAAGPELHAALIVRRNRAWADQIETRLAGSGRVFIAVGAAHLVGEDSVVDFLRARGIEVKGP